MKNKLKLLMLCGSILGLVTSCGETANSANPVDSATSAKTSDTKKDSATSNKKTDSSEQESDAKASSSSSAPAVIPTLSEFLVNIADYNATVTNTYYGIDFYGANAMNFNNIHSSYAEYAGSSVCSNGSGIWSWSTDDNGAFELGELTTPTTLYSDLTVVDSDYYDAMDAFAESEDSWTVDEKKSNVYHMADDDDTNLPTAIANLGSYFVGEQHPVLGSKLGTLNSIEPYDVTLTIKDEHTATISFRAKVSGSKMTNGTLGKSTALSIKITNAGQNNVTGLEDFIDNPTDYTEADDFIDPVKDAMTEIIGASLDYENWTRGCQYSIKTDSYTKKQTSLTYYDLLSGDISTAFGADLVSGGWTAAGNETDSTYGITYYYYQKQIKAATDDCGAKIATITYVYEPSSLMSTPALYPNGIMIMNMAYTYSNIYTLDKVNAFLAKKPLKGDGTAALPQLDLSSYDLGNNIFLQDSTITANANGSTSYEGYYFIAMKFSTAEDSKTAMKAWVSSLENSKFKLDGTSTLDNSNGTSYKLTDKNFKNKLVVTVNLYNYTDYQTNGTSSTADPDGFVVVSFCY
jgi:hypothetical protein